MYVFELLFFLMKFEFSGILKFFRQEQYMAILEIELC